MDALYITAIAELTFLSLLALLLTSKAKITLVLLIGVAISWYIGVLRIEIFNETAAQEIEKGLRESHPSDGASIVFSFYLGWVPGMVYSLLVFGVGKVLHYFIVNKIQNENT